MEKTVLIKAEVIKTARSEMGLDNHALVKIDTATAEEKIFYVPKELIIDTDDIVSRKGLLEEYDRQHVGPPGGARKIIEKAPSAIEGEKADSQSIYLEETETRIDVTINALEYIAKAIEALDKRFDSIPMEQTSEILMLRKDLRELPPAQPPMPSNTSNALKALDSVNATQSNALGEQMKWNRMMLHLADLQLTYSPDWGANGQGDQKLYDFVTELIDEFSGWDVPDTNVGDTISRQAAINALAEQIALCDKALNSFEISMKDEYAVKVEKASLVAYKEQLENLPAAEPKRIRGRWIVETDWEGKTRTCICDQCGYETGEFQWENPNYCQNCGADMREVTE